MCRFSFFFPSQRPKVQQNDKQMYRQLSRISQQLIIPSFVLTVIDLLLFLVFFFLFGPLRFVQASLCNQAESRRWHDLNAPPCAASGSAVAPPASRNQWGQWANCGSVHSRWQKNGPSSYAAAHSATYKWVSPSALVA